MNPQPLDLLDCPLSGTRLIEASAGTGKTWAICGLYLRLLLERGLAVQQILVVTFTNAATAELRERVRSRIAQVGARLRGTAAADPFVDELLRSLRVRHGLSDDEIALRLDLALQTFDEASIFTIHGFCQRARADTPFTAGVPMALELLSDDSALRIEVVNDFWRNQVAGDGLAPALAAHLLSRKDSPERWAALLKRQLAKPLSSLIWPAALDTAGNADIEALSAAHAAAHDCWLGEREAIVACVTDGLPSLHAGIYKSASVQVAAASWDTLVGCTAPLAAPDKLEKLDLFTPTRLLPGKGRPAPRTHAFFALAGDLLARLAAARSALDLARLRLLRQLLAQAPSRLRALKRERRVVAFDDLLFNLHQGLCGGGQPGLAESLRARFPAALIDEFQDTDPLQFEIFKTVYGGSGAALFLVGDPKQAIYSFRNADLHTYLQARGEASAEYTLADNQRASAGLLAGLNALFSINPRAFVLPGLAYRPVKMGVKPRADWHDGTEPRAPLQLWTLPAGADGSPLPKARARRVAGQACAGEIARLLAGGQRREVRLGGRPLSGGDIAVLVRSHAQGGEMRRALAALGVGSVELSQASVFRSSDAEDLERVLAAVLEPSRERLLRAALATDLLGLDAASVVAVSADEAKLLDLVTRFSGYREMWLRRGVGVMLRRLMVAEGVDRRLLARADGERRLTNLLHLCEALHEAAEGQGSPERLLRWLQIRRTEDGHGDEAAQLRLESDRNLVQIVTVHKSKGLEYPLVFCPFLWDGHSGGAPGGPEGREYHDADGRPVVDFSDSADNAAVKAQVALEKVAENLRLVYVALTRAVHRCTVVVGSYTVGRHRSVAESSRSRLNSLVAGAAMAPADWQKNRLSPGDIAAAWRSFSQAHAPGVGLQPLPAGPWPRIDPVRPAADALAALPAPASIAPAWWIGSYSSLSLGARHEGAAIDHDARLASPEADDEREPVAATVVDENDILNFPRGAEAGNCIHAVFERADFGDPAGWPEAIAAALREQPQGRLDAERAARLPRMLGRMLADVMTTRLPGGLVLGELPRGRRLVELEFTLPAPQLTAAALSALLREHGYPVPPLGFAVLEGYLRGFIDLVFEQGGRFHLIDWKSNHLGSDAAAYGPGPVARAMREQGYPLQALLYTVALHRHLQHRLPDYDYERHFGTVLYLFVRGVRPGWTTPAGEAAGVHVDRPPRQLVERLAALFGAAAAPAGREAA